MRRDIADLRTTFSVEGAEKPVNAAKDAAAALDGLADAAGRQSRASERAAAAGAGAANAARDQADSIVRASRDAADAQVKATRDVIDVRARAEKSAEAAVRAAQARYEALRKAAADRVRLEQGKVDTEAGERREAAELADVAKAGTLTGAKRQAARAAAALNEWDKDNKNRRFNERAQEERADLEEQVASWERTVRNLQRGGKQDKVKRRGVEEAAQREAAERIRLVREVEDAKVAEARRSLDELRRLLAAETIAAKEAAAAQVRAAQDAARARARAAAEAAREFRKDSAAVDRITKEARRSYERAMAKRDRDGDVRTGLADPAKLRADAKAAADAYARAAADLVTKAEASQARVAAAAGTDDAAKVAQREKRSLAGTKGDVTKKEAEARRLAEVLAEVERRLKAAEKEGERAAAALDRIAQTARRVREEFREAAAFRIDLDRAIRNPRQAEALAKAWAAAYERAAARVAKAAADAQAAIAAASGNPEDLARVKVAETAKVEALQRTAERVRAQASRSGAVWKEVERIQTRAAKDAAKSNEDAARRSAAAWDNAARRLGRIQRALPTLLGTRPGVMSRLANEGSLRVVGGAFGRVGRLLGGIAGTAGSAVSGVTGLFGSVIGLAGRAAGSVLNIGFAAVTAAGRLALHLGEAAISTLAKLSSGAVSTAAKVASIGKTVVVRAVVAGAGLGIAGYAAAKKAVGDTAEATREVREGAAAIGAYPLSFQALTAAAKRAGVDMRDFQGAVSAAHQAISNVDKDPALADAMARIGVTAKNADGTLLDVGDTIRRLMGRLNNLPGGEQWDVLNRVFGGPENVQRMLPLLRQMAQDTNTLNRALGRQMQLGSLFLPVDFRRMIAWNAGTNDLKDAFTGLKLAVARSIGPDIIAGMYRMSDLIAANRDRVAWFARYAYDLAKGLGTVVLTGRKLGDTVWPVDPAARFAKALLNGAFHARALALGAGRIGAEFISAYSIISRQQTTQEQLYYRARGWVGVLASAVVKVQVLGKEFVAAFRGTRAQMDSTAQVFIAARQWVIDLTTVGFRTALFFKEFWKAVRGKDEEVTRFPWLLTLRDGLATVGRFARETWSAVRGDTAAVQEFPVLLKIREGALATFNWIRDFAREAWAAVRGKDLGQEARFPWLATAADAVRAFVANVRETASDLGNVWNGFDPQTALGEKLKGAMETVTYYRDQLKLAWEDLGKVFDGESNAQQKFNFPWIKDVAVGFEELSNKVKKAWDVFRGFYDFFDRSLQRMTAGKLDLGTAALVTGMLSLFGVTRVVVGGFKGLARVGGLLRGLFGGGAAAGAAGGLAGAMGAAGRAAETAGRAADRSAGLWARLGSSIGGVARNLAANPGIWALLGIGGGIAGDVLGRKADPEHGEGRGWAIAGGALQGAGTGLMLGAMTGNLYVAAGTTVAGLAWGAYSGGEDYHAKRKAALAAQLRQAGHHDVAEKVEASAAAGEGVTPEGLSDSERSTLGEADAELGAAEERLAEVMRPVGQDIAAIRQAMTAGGGRSADSTSGWDEPPPRFGGGAVAAPIAAAAASAATVAATAAANAASERAERRAAADPMRRLMQGSDPMSGLYARPPAPVTAPSTTPAAGSDRRAEAESEFTVKLVDGRELRFSGSRTNVSALRDEMSRGLPAPAWANA